MNFTREPIIETVITPKEGFKLLVRGSRMDTGDEYQVDAIEVVSFGKALFFRSLEKPKAFLLPVSDYELIEIKETRVVLKKAVIDKPIKIAGGKKSQREVVEETPKLEPQPIPTEVAKKALPADEEPKKGRKRKRGRGGKKEREAVELKEEKSLDAPLIESEAVEPPQRKMRALLPPPSGLISDTISRYKDVLLPKENEDEHAPLPLPAEETLSSSELDYLIEDEPLPEYRPYEDEGIMHTFFQGDEESHTEEE